VSLALDVIQLRFHVLSTLDTILLFQHPTTCGYVSVAVVIDREVLENTWQTFSDEIACWTAILKRCPLAFELPLLSMTLPKSYVQFNRPTE
jgi:hypothetical protein